ncbi:hypothetical protein JZU54_07165 [bacterium]|nr:hypothetical protein [bacterium]
MAAIVGGAIVVMRWPWSLRSLGLPLMLPALLWQVPKPVPGQFDLWAADIGQGNAVLVRTAKHALLYDAGPQYSAESDAGQRVLVPLLSQFGARLDRVLLSHRDRPIYGVRSSKGIAWRLCAASRAAMRVRGGSGTVCALRFCTPT